MKDHKVEVKWENTIERLAQKRGKPMVEIQRIYLYR